MNESAAVVSLDELIAFNDELAALVEAGVPLELGLREYSRDARGALAEVTQGVAARMSSGSSLGQALDSEAARLPKLYRALIQAGCRSGRLPDALESVAEFAARVKSLRKRIGLALIYPALVAWLSFLLFVAFVVLIVPRYAETYASLRIPTSFMLEWLIYAEGTLMIWFWIPPALLLIAAAVCRRNADSAKLASSGGSLPFWWVPGMRGVIRFSEVSGFSSLLATLIQHDVPLDEAVTLAADASGSLSIQRAAGQVSTSLTRGESLSVPSGLLPPFVVWLLTRGAPNDVLADNLRDAGSMYRRMAESRAEWIRFGFPVLATLYLGGVVTLIYVLLVFLPFLEFLNAMLA